MKVPTWQFPSLLARRDTIGSTARRAVYFALAALVVACGENVTAPSASRTPMIPESATPDVVVMERTTDIAAHDGVAAVHQTSKQTLAGQVRIQQEQNSGAAASVNARFDVAHLPRPSISLPARYETAMCSALPRWTQTIRGVVGTGGDVEMTGVGDAPASTLRVVQDGRTVSTVERTWVRTSISWQLERQVTTTADGRYRDVVTYQHLTATRQAVNNALPVATCATSLSSAKVTSPAIASRSYYAPHVSSFLSPPTGASSYLGDGCSDYYGGDPCYDKQIEVYAAEAILAVAGSAMTYSCLVAEPLIVAACVTTTAAYTIAYANLFFAKAKLDNCRAEQAAKKCGCGTAAYSLGTAGTNGGLSKSVSPGTTGTIGAPKTSPSYLGDGCGDGGGYGGGGGGYGGGGGGGTSSCGYEVWEISYDGGKTWQYWGTFWTCYTYTM